MARSRRRNLLITTALIAASIGSASAAFAGNCSSTDVSNGTCAPRVTGQIGEGRAELRGSAQGAGSPEGGASGGSSNTYSSDPDDPIAEILALIASWRREDPTACHPSWALFGGCGNRTSTPPDEHAQEPPPAVAIEEVATFVPTPPEDDLEPGSWIAVRDLPANFISNAREEIVSATLFGLPAEVRFIPVGWAWDTGDGERVESRTGGATWERLRQDELTDTKTSHRYDERGWYTVQPTVTYAAEYRVDGGAWTPMHGTLDVAGPAYDIRIVTVETRLVRGSCKQYPNDWGCE